MKRSLTFYLFINFFSRAVWNVFITFFPELYVLGVDSWGGELRPFLSSVGGWQKYKMSTSEGFHPSSLSLYRVAATSIFFLRQVQGSLDSLILGEALT